MNLIRGERGDALRAHVLSHASQTQALLAEIGVVSQPGPATILPVILGEASRALEISARLREAGFLIPCIRYPTVARGSARLRITVSALHSSAQIHALGSALRELLAPQG